MSEEGRLPAEETGSPANSGAIKKFALLFVGLLVIYIAWGMIRKGKDQPVIKSEAEQQLEAIQAKNQKRADQASSTPQKVAGEQAMGDTQAMKLLSEVQKQREAEVKAQQEAEEQAQMVLEELHYQRRLQGLPYEVQLAQAWDQRLRDLQTGKNLSRRNLTLEEEKLIKAKNPLLWAKLQSARAQGVSAMSQAGGKPLLATGTPGYAGGPKVPAGSSTASVVLPPSIDPRTGLPISATGGDPGGISGLLPDGTPDLEGGAYPIQVTYVPVGGKDPISTIRWVKPGYLIGRSRPYNPNELLEADRNWRAALRSPTDTEPDKTGGNVLIPIKPTSNRQRVQSGDFCFIQRYVVVLPNPKGQLDPPNTPSNTSTPSK